VIELQRLREAFRTSLDLPPETPVDDLHYQDHEKWDSLAHMSQIVESDNAQILSSYVRTFPDSTRMEVTLKVNKTDISNIIATFLRYEYDVKATFNHSEHDDGAMDRYASLMNYLNL